MKLIKTISQRKEFVIQLSDTDLVLLMLGYGQTSPKDRKDAYIRRFGHIPEEVLEANNNHRGIYQALEEMITQEYVVPK